MKDKKQFKKIKEGNKEAFEKLFRKYYEGLVRFVWGYVNSRAVAEELVQDLFLKLWEESPELEIDGNIKTYLYSAARNISIDHQRHQDVERSWKEERKELHNIDERPLLDDRLHKKMLVEEIRKAIQELPKRRREIFMLSRYENMSYREIADFLGISVSTVKTQMSRALKKLRKAFDAFIIFLF